MSDDDQYTSGENSILGGNQVNAPISAPINIGGIAAGVLGSAEVIKPADEETEK